jgi:hypothetical protein
VVEVRAEEERAHDVNLNGRRTGGVDLDGGHAGGVDFNGGGGRHGTVVEAVDAASRRTWMRSSR